jgi:5-formyltetrahydrofolate cyclo-ligase
MSPVGGRLSASGDKKSLRRIARVKRRSLVSPEAGRRLCEAFLAASIPFPHQSIIGGYWPIGGEIDPRPLMTELSQVGMICVLPVVVASAQKLIFRQWKPGEALETGRHGTYMPSASAIEQIPDLILVPVLAFDKLGYRLGQGGGYYDRTLAALRAVKSVVAVGLAYAGQEIDEVPYEDHDAKLDWIVTENWARKIEL